MKVRALRGGTRVTRVCPICERWDGWEVYGSHRGGCECRGCVRSCWRRYAHDCDEAARDRDVADAFWCGVSYAIGVRP